MSDELLCRRHNVSMQHLDMLAQYMERHPPMALASARSRDELVQSKRMWEKFARTLNTIDSKVVKSGRSWARYWCNLKFKVRHKYMCIKRCQTEGARCGVHLTPYEARIIKILTDDEGNLVPPPTSIRSLFKAAARPLRSNKLTERKSEETEQKPPTNDRFDDSGPEDTLPNTYSFDYPGFNSKDSFNTEMVSIEALDIKPALRQEQDPIQITDCKKTTDDLRRDIAEFELMKSRELFAIEKRERREKHELEIAILRLRKQILEKELKS